MKTLFYPIFALILFSPHITEAISTPAKLAPEIKAPETVLQGEPLIIQVKNSNGVTDVAKIIWNNKSLWFFNYNRVATAFYGVDLLYPPGQYKISVKMEYGSTLEKILTVNKREQIEEPLGIPEKLGGDTPQAATNLVNTLSRENAVLNNVRSAAKKYWRGQFALPLAQNTVTDTYGYLRKTGYYKIPHKGMDLRAAYGTEVYASNRGVIRLVRTFTVYGKTVVIDHGLGVLTYYMHLSKINVTEGQMVEKGDVIGLSGDTGYAEVPHLHLTVKINKSSIDPQKFFSFFDI